MAWQPRQHEDGTQARDSKQRRLLHALPGRTRNGLLQRPTGGLKNQHFSIALRLMISAPNSQFGATDPLLMCDEAQIMLSGGPMIPVSATHAWDRVNRVCRVGIAAIK